jgi:hypothetical protein
MNEFPNGWRDFFIKEISEPVEHIFRVVLVEAEVSQDAEQISELSCAALPLEHDATDRFIEIIWKDCISYSILNEIYTSVGPKNSTDGSYISMLETFDQSDYIDYLKKISFADRFYPGPFKHSRLSSLTHIIDVISLCPPVFRKIRSNEVDQMKITTRQFQALPKSL